MVSSPTKQCSLDTLPAWLWRWLYHWRISMPGCSTVPFPYTGCFPFKWKSALVKCTPLGSWNRCTTISCCDPPGLPTGVAIIALLKIFCDTVAVIDSRHVALMSLLEMSMHSTATSWFSDSCALLQSRAIS